MTASLDLDQAVFAPAVHRAITAALRRVENLASELPPYPHLDHAEHS